MKIWNDITKNPKTGHYIALDLFKAVCFVAGVFLTLFSAVAKFLLVWMVIYADYSMRWINVDPPLAPGIILIGFGLGAQAGKIINTYLGRLTMDGNSNPLATVATADVSPPLRPQLMPTPEGTAEDTAEGSADVALPTT